MKKSNLKDIVKPALVSRVSTKGIPNFLVSSDKNKSHQSHIWNNKTYEVDPKTHVFTTIQERFGNKLIKNIPLPPGAVVVDIGCFIGEKLWQVSDHKNYLGIGVDIALDSLKAAQKIDIYGHKFIAADMEHLPFKDNSIDLIMVFDVIEHLSHPEKGFSEIARVLKPGGKLLLHIPLKDNKWSMFWWKRKLFPALAQQDYDDVGHSDDRMYTSFQLRQYMNSHGMIVNKEIFYNAFFTHFFDRELVRIISAIYSRFFNSVSSKEKNNVVHTKKNPLRNIYADYVVPLFQVISYLDKPLSWLKIGNTAFYLAEKDATLDYYVQNEKYSEFLESANIADYQLYVDAILKYSRPKSKFLDVGCGTGGVVDKVSGQDRNGYGIEISRSSIKKAKNKNGKFYEYDGIKIPFPNNTFDVVGSWNVLEHVRYPEKILDEQVRVTKPGGVIIIGTPNFLSLTNSYHPHTAGWRSKVRNCYLIGKKLLIYLGGSYGSFSKMSLYLNEKFFPDADAVNLTNLPDILMWARYRKLRVIKSYGSLMDDASWIGRIRNHVPFKFLSGGVFVVARKAK